MVNKVKDVASVLVYWKRNNEVYVALVRTEQGRLALPKSCPDDHSRSPARCEAQQSTTTAATSVLPPPWPMSFKQIGQDVSRECVGVACRTPTLLQVTRSLVTHTYSHHWILAAQLEETRYTQIKAGDKVEQLSLTQLRSLPPHQLERHYILTLTEQLVQSLGKERKEKETGARMVEVGPQLLWEQVVGQEKRSELAMLRIAELHYSSLHVMYELFQLLSHPHGSLVLEDLMPLLADLGWQGREDRVFRALDRRRKGELGFEDFVYGMVALDPATIHGKEAAEVRCCYIFRYYDINNDGVLQRSEVEELIEDICHQKNLEVTTSLVQEKTNEAYKIFSLAEDAGVPLITFLQAVGTLRLRGTSFLFRSSIVLSSYMSKRLQQHRQSRCEEEFRCPSSPGLDNKKFKHSHSPETQSSNGGDKSQSSLGEEAGSKGSPLAGSYQLAQHTVKLHKSGQVTDIHNLLDMERAGEVMDTGLEGEENRGEGESVRPRQARHHRGLDRFQSRECFNTSTLQNRMIQALHIFENSSDDKPELTWGMEDMMQLGNFVITLANTMKGVFETEPRLVHVAPPCYILGDLHGNYKDLMHFEKALWPKGPELTPANVVCLGDYVDRGPYGLEVVSHLFSLKLNSPTSFFLLRGNHEVGYIQKNFTFHQECMDKFGEKLGQRVWDAMNAAFDCMPLAALVDNSIFCIHGGIPKLEGSLTELEKIPCPLPDPEFESPLAWEIMWNDPFLPPGGMTKSLQEEFEVGGGFAFNVKRQTACVFSEAAFKAFTKKHSISHVIRAHEVKQTGFEVQQGGRLLTVFSSSHYAGGSNEAACVLIHNYRIRFIRIDTT